ncbi:hypothetical protein D3C78_1543400 [compost metagenome]
MFSLHISSAKGHAMSVKFRRWSQHVATGHPKKNPQGPGSPLRAGGYALVVRESPADVFCGNLN